MTRYIWKALLLTLLIVIILVLSVSCTGTPKAPTVSSEASGSPKHSLAPSLSSTKPLITWTPRPNPTPTPEESLTEWPMATPMPEPTPVPKDAPLAENDYFFITIENTPGIENDYDEGSVERMGVVNARGEVVMQPKYSDIYMFSKNNGSLAMFFAIEYEISKYTRYDYQTDKEFPSKALFPGSYGKFYSPDGRPKNERRYVWARKLRGQYIAAMSASSGKVGVMDYGFIPLISFKYDYIEQMKSLYAAIGEKDGKYFIDFYDNAGNPKGNLEIGSEYVYYDEYVSDNILLAQGLNGKFGFINEKMTWIEPPNIALKKEDYEYEYNDSTLFYDTLDEYVNRKTDEPYKKLLPSGYINIVPFLDDQDIQVKHDGKLLYLADNIDNYVTPSQSALVNQDGKILFETKIHLPDIGGTDSGPGYGFYPEGIILSDGRAYDFDGKELVPGLTGIVSYLPSEKFFLCKTACYTADGRKLPFPDAKNILHAANDRFIVVLPDGKQGLCNADGLWLVAPTDRIHFVNGDDSSYSSFVYDWQIIEENHNVGRDDQYSTYGLLDPNGKVVMEPIYDDIQQDGELYSVHSGQNQGLVDAWGHWIWYTMDFDRLMD